VSVRVLSYKEDHLALLRGSRYLSLLAVVSSLNDKKLGIIISLY